MSRECRYICQRAANAIISEIGPYRVSTDALIGINQILDEFLVQLLTNCQFLNLSRIKTSVFTLLPSTLGKNAIVEAELEVKTFTETEVIDYDIYEKMRLLGETPSIFPLKECLPLLRDKCFEYCTLADKDDQQSWYPHPEPDGISISPIVAIYVTTVLEHMAEYILTAVAVTAENEDTDYVRIKELFLALVDDVQIGHTFHNMDLCEKMEKRIFPHGYQRYRPSLTPTPTPNSGINKSQSFIKSSGSENGNFLDITFDDMDLNYEEDENTSQRFSGFAMHNSSSNPSLKSHKQRPTSLMTNGSTHHSLRTAASSNSLSNKKAFKVFKNESSSISLVPDPILSSSPVYDPDTPTMNFEDLIRSGNTMRVSLTPNRLKSIETKDQMIEDPAPAKPAWQRRSSSVPRMSTSSTTPTSSRPQTPTSFQHPLPHHKPSPLVKTTSNSITKSTSISTLDDSSINTSSVITNNSFKSTKSKSYVAKIDNRFENPRDAPKPPVAHSSSFTSSLSTSSTSSSSGIKMAEKTLPTPTSSTSSRQSKNRSPIPTDMKSVDPSPAPKTSNNNNNSNNKDTITPSSSPKSAHETIKSDHTSNKSTTTTTTTTTTTKVGSTISSRPTLRRSSVSSKKSRENLRRLKEQEETAAAVTVDKSEKVTSAKSSMDISRKNNNEITKNEKSSIKRVDSATSSLSSSSSSLSLKKSQQQKVKKENGVKKSLESSSSESVDTLSSNEVPYTQEPDSIQQNEIDNNNKQPERPSSIVAKRASGSSRRQSLHESYAMEIGKEFSKEKKDQPLPSSTTTTAGTVGSTIKQLDEVVKQKSTSSITTSKPPIDIKRSNISKNIQEIENKNENDQQQQQQQEISSPLLATSKSSKSLSSSSLSLSSSSITSASSRRSLVLDKVLQFERAHSVDDVTQRRSSSYIPRRERFMYLQRDPNALVERSTTTTLTTTSSIVRPGTSASIAAAAARFAAGVSLGIQTDQQEEQEEKVMTPSTPTLVVTDESGHSKNASSTLSAKNKKLSSSSIMKMNNDLDSDNDSGSEHGIVEGDEEWFLPDDEWEDIQEQENAVAEWLLGEA
ncbi:unnamed protein product [Cunninghamella echinulata]